MFSLRIFAALYFLTFPGISLSDAYVTWEGSEPDKAATAWLIARHVDQSATFLFIPVGNAIIDETSKGFDMPSVPWRRTSRYTAFRSVLRDLGMETDHALISMDRFIHALEFQKWARPTDAGTLNFEAGLAKIRDRHGTRIPPITEFFPFFDDTYQRLQQSDDFSGDEL